MELEPWGQPARGLREHVRQVAEALGYTDEAFCVQTEDPVSAYLPLDEHFYGFPDQDAALLWDATHGWSAVIEDGTEPLVIAYLGALLPAPELVARFVADLVAGRKTGTADPTSVRISPFRVPPAVLRAQLADRAPELALTG
jgi:hypothetical protein